MGLFSKEKGLILSILNAILVIWIVGACVSFVANISYVLVKDHQYTYEEYETVYCDLDYETEEECKNYFISYELDQSDFQINYLRDSIISAVHVLLVTD